VGAVIALNIIISLLVVILLQFAGMYVFSLMTPYKDREEINKGNLAVGLTMGGKFLATAIILAIAAYTNSSIWHMGLWFLVGYVCLLATYWVFDWLTPGFSLSKQLQEGNVAVGTMLACVYVGIALAIGSLII
jgi:putative membrane protein